MLGTRDCWIFDLDGTLTVPNHDFDAIRAELGIPEGHLILEYLATLPAADAEPMHRRLDDIERSLAMEVVAHGGCRTLLEHLADGGRRLGILTRNTRDNALLILERVGVADLFAAGDVLGRGEAAPKPDPAGIQHLLQRWDADRTRAVMVGDFLLDLEAGRNAGVCTVHMDVEGRFPWPELTDVAVRSLEELHAQIATRPDAAPPERG